ncbi:MAG: ComF family protein [Actinobacteria bacterium]|nr:ComF family protein [Actinomycetota bacterium]
MEKLADLPPRPNGLAGLVALFEYTGLGREVILALKHTRGVDAVPDLADALADGVRRANWDPSPSVVTWVPTTADRRSARGYDQSRLLAKAVARRLRLPCRRLLVRHGRAQQGLGATARRRGPELAVRRALAGPVLIVDDVLTTGATLSAAASTLRAAGAPEVFAAVVAFAPPGHDRTRRQEH